MFVILPAPGGAQRFPVAAQGASCSCEAFKSENRRRFHSRHYKRRFVKLTGTSSVYFNKKSACLYALDGLNLSTNSSDFEKSAFRFRASLYSFSLYFKNISSHMAKAAPSDLWLLMRKNLR